MKKQTISHADNKNLSGIPRLLLYIRHCSYILRAQLPSRRDGVNIEARSVSHSQFACNLISSHLFVVTREIFGRIESSAECVPYSV